MSENQPNKDSAHELCPKPPPVFVREATGLVKELGLLGTFSFSLGYSAFFSSFGYIPLVVGIVPGSNFVLGLLMAGGVQLITVFAYIFLSTSMPRSGGDYVWTSRAIHPLLGFVDGWVWFISAIFFTAGTIYFAVTFFLTPTLSFMGSVSSNASLISLSASISTPLGIMVVSSVIALILAAIAIFGTRVTGYTLFITIIVGVIGTLILAFTFLTTSASTFAANFQAITGQSVSSVVPAAISAGYSTQPVLVASIAAIPLWLTTFVVGTQYPAYLGGEIKKANRNLTWGLVLGTVGLIAIFMVGLVPTINLIGSNFYSALSYLFVTGSSKYPVPGGFDPSPQLLVYLATDNLSLSAGLSIAGFVLLSLCDLTYYYYISRVIFAMSFDRMLPSSLAGVNERTHSPLRALAVVVIGTIATMYLWIEGFAGSLVNGSIILASIFLITCITTMVYPFTKKDVFATSPYNRKIGGLPMVTLVGAVGAIFWVIILGVALTNPALGALGIPVYTYLTVMVISGIVVYYVMKTYRKSHGIDISNTFKEIPPE